MQHLKPYFNLERKVSKTARPMRIAFLHIEPVANSQDLKNFALWKMQVGSISLFQSSSV